MKLNIESLKNKETWEKADVNLPQYDINKMIKTTNENPVWVHFGAGNIFRGFIACIQQNLLNLGLAECGIIASDTFDYDIIDKIYTPFDNLTILVTLNPDGSMLKEIVGSVADSIPAKMSDSNAVKKLHNIFANPSLQMVSFTITEKGYQLNDIQGNLLNVVKSDIIEGPENAKHAMSVVTAMLLYRFKNGAFPIAMVSMDNCSHNGEKLQTSVFTIADGWKEKGHVNDEFISYLHDESKVTFPWSMIDKITPRPDASVQNMLENYGIKNMNPVITGKNTFIAPFVNAEAPQYLVIEDKFPNGRPPLEKSGVFMTDRETVNNTDRMKVTTCLNPLHTALAIFGCLLGFKFIWEEMNDPDLKKFVEVIGYKEGMPVVINPNIFSPMDFIYEVINVRLPNPFIPDTPQRIATDTSQKISIRFGETLKSYISSDNLEVMSLSAIPLTIAGWFRYLLGTDDNENVIEISSDPMLSELKVQLEGIVPGKPETYNGQLKKILANKSLFAVDLVECGLSEKIETMFCEMLAGKGAVRETLHNIVKVC